MPIYIQAEKIQDEERKIQEKMSPQIKSIKKNFKGDEQFMLLRTCYRQHNYNPIMAFRSSLSLLIQIPFFIAAYLYFSNSNILNNTYFIADKTLAQPDGLVSILGFSINIFPIVMTIINIVSAEVYAWKKPLKDRIQMYSFAFVFLILLYNSPVGLVIYWTFNNLFSLLKNIGLKKQNPLAVLSLLSKIIAFIIIVKIVIVRSFMINQAVNEQYIIILGILLFIVLTVIPQGLKEKFVRCIDNIKFYDYKLFLISAMTLAVIIGILIPIIVISSSMDFIEYMNQNLWNVIYNVFAISLGIYLFWPIVIYYFANDKIRKLLTIVLSSLGLFFAINLCMYSGEFGILSVDFVFKVPQYSIFKMIFDFCIIAVIIFAIYHCFIKYKNTYVKKVLICLIITSVGFSIFKCLKINDAMIAYNKNIEKSRVDKDLYKPIKISKYGKNVLVIFIDRAMGFYAREIFEENTDFQKQFEGFTLYPNTVSFQGQTFLGYLPMIAGYEYTPTNINKRTNQVLEKVATEAYLVLPKIFINNGFTSTIVRPHTFGADGNYSIYDNSGIELFKLQNFDDYYQSIEHDEHEITVLMNLKSGLKEKNGATREFLSFSNYMVLPSFMKKLFYDNKKTNKYGISKRLAADYMHLAAMRAYTNIENSDEMYFNIFNSEEMHIKKYDQPYGKEHKYMEAEAFYVIAKYINFLKENNVYDNTKIIIVSDHGHWLQDNKYLDVRYTSWNPLLMVKDFNSNKKFIFDFNFMTNADMPILATEGIIANPQNPYTGRFLKNEVSKGSVKILSSVVGEAKKNRVPQGSYYSVSDDIYKSDNWKLLEGQ